jgi:hypothetical protein
VEEMTSDSWQRSGTSVIWSPELLKPLVMRGDALSLREPMVWLESGFPDEPPVTGQTVLIGGLQTVLETAETPDAAFRWLRERILPLVRKFQDHWPGVGVVFGMDGPKTLFSLNESDDLIDFGRARDRGQRIKLSLGIWNGAATGSGAYQLVIPDKKEVGGYHVRRVS